LEELQRQTGDIALDKEKLRLEMRNSAHEITEIFPFLRHHTIELDEVSLMTRVFDGKSDDDDPWIGNAPGHVFPLQLLCENHSRDVRSISWLASRNFLKLDIMSDVHIVVSLHIWVDVVSALKKNGQKCLLPA
jgi:hypothetical protein